MKKYFKTNLKLFVKKIRTANIIRKVSNKYKCVPSDKTVSLEKWTEAVRLMEYPLVQVTEQGEPFYITQGTAIHTTTY